MGERSLGKYLTYALSNTGKANGRSRENIHDSAAEQMREKKSGGGRRKYRMAPKVRGHNEP